MNFSGLLVLFQKHKIDNPRFNYTRIANIIVLNGMFGSKITDLGPIWCGNPLLQENRNPLSSHIDILKKKKA